AEFFHGSLDGQRGRSESFFRHHLKTESRLAWRTRNFLIGAFGAGLAATVAALWATPILHPSPRPNIVSNLQQMDLPTANPDLIHPVIEHVVNSRTRDEGVMMLDDDTPVRVFRRQAVERTRYFDEHDSVQS